MYEKIIKKIEYLFKEIFENAKQQLLILKKEGNQPINIILIAGKKYLYKKDIAKIKSEPRTFLYLMIDIFWDFFDLISNNIRSPLIQFTMRPLIELCYRQIIYFASLENKKEQKELATKYWLYTEGLTQEKTSYTTYNVLIDELSEIKDKNYFKELKEKKFPKEEIFKTIKSIFPPIRDEGLLKQIEPYLEEIWGITLNKEYLKEIYLWFCQYIHSNIFLLKNLKEEEKDKTHILRCSTILFLTGYHLLNFTNENILVKDKIPLTVLKINIKEILDKLAEIRGIPK